MDEKALDHPKAHYSPNSSPQPGIVPLPNNIVANPSLLLMTNELPPSVCLLFTHNYPIKGQLTTIILDNDSQKNLSSHNFLTCLQLIRNPHPSPYCLGWVQQHNPCFLINKHSTITFSIGPFQDTI